MNELSSNVNDVPIQLTLYGPDGTEPQLWYLHALPELPAGFDPEHAWRTVMRHPTALSGVIIEPLAAEQK